MATALSSDVAPSDFCLVLVTVPNETSARTIAQSLLTEKLAACIKSFGVDSCYHWEGEVQQDKEFQLLIKTRRSCFEPLVEYLSAIHPYEVPEIVAIPMIAGAMPYLNWIEQNTQAR
jgi:periplasmic divalent cation tolerance protein